MKHVFLYLSLCLVVFTAIKQDVFAQKKAKKKISYNAKIGDKYFENSDYYFASQSYQKAIKENKEDFHAHFRLGESYRAMFEYAKAEKAYQTVANSEQGNQEFPLAMFWYGLMLKTNGKYAESKEYLTKFKANFKPQTEEEKSYVDWAELEYLGTVLALEQLQKAVRNFELKPLPAPVNSKNSDYAPVIFKNDSTIIITSGRARNKGSSNTDPRSGDIYSDNLRFYKDETGKWQPMRIKDDFESAINTEVSEGAGVFNTDYTKYYYTNCSASEYCAIYVSKFENGKWQKPTKLNENINPKNVSAKQPALSPTGDTLFFVMEKEGGKGQNDIWMATKSGNEENWNNTINLQNINTSYVDMSPCFYILNGEPVLFFASNGRESFGGLDIFMAKGKNFEYIVNVGLPFNSSGDDFYFSVGEKKGYLSSNREGGQGKDDIYTFNITSKAFLIQTIAQDSITGYDSLAIAQRLKEMKLSEPKDAALAQTEIELKNSVEPKRRENWKLSEMETERLSKLSAAELEVVAKQKELEALEAKKAAMAALEKEQTLKNAEPNRKQDANLTAMGTDKTQQLSAAELALIAERKEAEASEIRKLAQNAIEKETTLAKLEPRKEADVRLANLPTDKEYTNLTIEEKRNLLAKKEAELIDLRENIASADKEMAMKANAEPNRKKADIKLSNLETDNQYVNLTAEEKAALLAKKEKLSANPVQKNASMEDKEVKLKTKEATRRQDVRLDNMETDDKLDLSEIKPLIAPKFNYYLDELSIFGGKKIKSRTVYSQIYFKFDNYHVSNINYKIMDKLIAYAKKYPNVRIEITATTDNVGTEDYNKALAYRRGKSAWDYMVEGGVNHEQLIINPIGIDEKATPEDKPTDRWKYRRVDFHIIVLEP